ncbi:MAG TPA: NAD(P)/FAD-dependent oxidoreductase [Acidimicrobiales bacterium]|nr:NAD(P)/FAD-dependent oxidoreductase [Acidimicrobiales bacterium]
MTTTQADVVVLGLGPGGEEAAGRLAEAGLDVVGIEGNLLGGECPYWGCVPSKMMIRAANLVAETRRVPGMAGTSSVTPDWAPVARRIREEATDNWDDRVAVERFEDKGGRFVRGWGRLDGPKRVAVGDDVYEARRAVIVASGDKPWFPPIPGLAELEGQYWTNRQAIEAETLPRSLVVLGGGAIGVELAQVFARFGVDVDVVEGAGRLIAAEEPEASGLLEAVFGREDIGVHTGVKIAAVRRTGDGFTLDIEGGTAVSGEKLLVATGRRPDLTSINASSIGVDEEGRGLPVDEHLRVTDGVWAIGDVTGVGAFTHVSMYQANIVVLDILGENPPAADYRALPRVTFTDPEIGSVGLTEDQARRQGIEVHAAVTEVPTSARGWIHKAGNEGFIKLVEDHDTGRLVGATSAGPTGGEVLSMLTLAVHAGITTDQLRQMIYAYPTFHRTVEAALGELCVVDSPRLM